MNGNFPTSWAGSVLLLAVCWIGLPATTTGQAPSGIIDLRNQVDQLQSVLELLKHDLSESRSLLKQAVDLRTEIEQAVREKTAQEANLKKRQQLLETLGVWSSADLVLGDRNSSRVVALRRSAEGWTVMSIATRPFQQYALAAADQAGVSCRADAQTEAQLKEVLRGQPPGPFVPFTIRDELLTTPASPVAPPAEQPKPAPPAPTPPQPTQPADSSAVYQLIQLPVKPGDPPRVLGTAFAIDKHFLVTSGSLLYAFDEPTDDAPRLAIRLRPQAKEIRVAHFGIHPRFRDEVRKQWKQRQELVARTPLSRADSLKLAALDRSAAVFDMGLLIVDEELPEVLEISSGRFIKDEAVRVRSWSATPASSIAHERAADDFPGKIVDLDSTGPMQLVASLPPRADWSGSPILGKDGSVRGLYTCPLRIVERDGQRRHFATSISQLDSLINAVLPPTNDQ